MSGTTPTLYALSAEMADILTQVDPETGELPEEFGTIQGLIQDKILACAAFCLEHDARAAQFEARAKELAAQAKKMRARTEWLDQYMAQAMRNADITQVQGGDFTVRLYPQRDASVEITDADLLPAEYRRVIPESWAPDKMALKKALQSGADIQGAQLVRRDRFVRK